MAKSDHEPLLPAGLHAHSLESLSELTVTPFPDSARRRKLFENLRGFLRRLSSLGVLGHCWVDGSFLCSKPEPDDIDLVLVVDELAANALPEQSRTEVSVLLDAKSAKERYGLHVFVIGQSDVNGKAYWRGFFGFQRDGATAKGIAVIPVSS